MKNNLTFTRVYPDSTQESYSPKSRYSSQNDLKARSGSVKRDDDEDQNGLDRDPLGKVLFESNSSKELGNLAFRNQRWQVALNQYTEALIHLPPRASSTTHPSNQQPSSSTSKTRDPQSLSDDEDDNRIDDQPNQDLSNHANLEPSNEPRIARLRSILNANKAACYLKLEDWQSAAQAAGLSLKDDPKYLKALHRRAQANEKLGTWASLQASLDDYNLIAKSPNVPPEVMKETKANQIRLPTLIAQRSEADKAEMVSKLKDLGNTVLGKFGMSTDNFKFTQNESGGYSMSYQP